MTAPEPADEALALAGQMLAHCSNHSPRVIGAAIGNLVGMYLAMHARSGNDAAKELEQLLALATKVAPQYKAHLDKVPRYGRQ